MAENLRTTKYNDGSAIPLVTESAAWAALTTPGYCYYGNTTNDDNIKKYGSLYNWYVVDSTNPKKIAPAGWHAKIGEATLADAILDRIVYDSYTIEIHNNGNEPSMREVYGIKD